MAQAAGVSNRGIELIGRSIADAVPDSGGVWLGSVWLGFGVGAPPADAPVGSVYFNTSGGTSTTMYVKESAGANGWVGK